MVNYKQVLLYIFTKLVGSGFALSIFAIFIFSSLNLFKISEELSSVWIWAVFYGYAILCSIIIDGICYVWPKMKRWTVYLYVMAGFLFTGFLMLIFLMFDWFAIIVFGIIGSIAARIYYHGMHKVSKSRQKAFIFGVVLPIHLIVISMADFTKKEDWEVIQEDASFQATFSYFNGEHKIPLHLKQGDVLSFQVNFHTKAAKNSRSSGWGYFLTYRKGEYLPMAGEEMNPVFHVEEDGKYDIVVRCYSCEGFLTVDWEIR